MLRKKFEFPRIFIIINPPVIFSGFFFHFSFLSAPVIFIFFIFFCFRFSELKIGDTPPLTFFPFERDRMTKGGRKKKGNDMNENMGQQDGNGSTVSLPLHQTEREKRRKLITKMLFYIFIASVFRVLSSSTFLTPNSPASLISCVKNDHIAGLVHVHNTSHKKRNCERCFICHIRRNEVYSSIKTAHTKANHLRVHSTLH